MSAKAAVGDTRLSPVAIKWTVIRRWIGAGRFTMVTIRSEHNIVRHLPASVVDTWTRA